MPTHSELKKKLDLFPGGLTWTDGGAGNATATIAAANNTFDQQRLAELERAANALGYNMTTSAGALVFVPRS